MSFKQDILKVPNLLSLSRIVLSPAAFFLFQWQGLTGQIVTLVFFSVVFLTDFFDGYLARKLKQQSELGRILDPLADKVIVFVILVALLLFRGIPWWIFLVMLVRDAFVLIGGLFIKLKTGKITESNIWGKAGTFIMMGSMVLFIFPELWFISVPALLISLFFIVFSFYTYMYEFLLIFVPSFEKRLMVLVPVVLLSLGIPLFFILQPGVPVEIKAGAAESDKARVIDGSVAQALLERYAPLIYMHKQERYLPVDVGSYFDHCVLKKYAGWGGLFDKALGGPPLDVLKFTLESAPDPQIKSGPEFRSQKNEIFYITLKSDPNFISQKLSHHYKKQIYGRAVETPVGMILQYWFFFLAQESNNSGFLLHGADWKFFMLRLDKESKALEAAFSVGSYGFVYDFQDIKVHQGRPVLYVAKGSHGLYPEPGNHKAYFDSQRSFRLGNDSCSRDFLLEPRVYHLEQMAERGGWLDFAGYWEFPGFLQVLGPRFLSQRKPDLNPWYYPHKWMDFYR